MEELPPKIHFMYDPGKEPDASFARMLVRELGQARLENADKVVSIGGDGMLLRALHNAPGKKVAGIVSPGSASRGFWTNRGIENAADLTVLFQKAGSYKVKPLRLDITFADGSQKTRYAYNDASVRWIDKDLSACLRAEFDVPETDVSVQSMLVNLKVTFASAVLGPRRVMGGALLFATALGSTAMNRSNGGPSLDIRNEGIILNGLGISEPAKGFNPVVNGSSTVFDVEVLSPDKRPVMAVYDSFAVKNNEKNSPVAALRVSMAEDRAAQLVLADDPGLRAYSAMMP